MLECESTTPFGSPVLPLLKMIVASASTETGAPIPAKRSNQRTGANNARHAAPNRSPADAAPAISSIQIGVKPGGSSISAFARNAFEVTTDRSPACSIADTRPAVPVV